MARLGPGQSEHEPGEKLTTLLTGLDLNGLCKDSPLGARSVISLQPAAQAIEAGVQYTFSDVSLVQFVANPHFSAAGIVIVRYTSECRMSHWSKRICGLEGNAKSAN